MNKTKETKKLRHDIYEYLELQFGVLTFEQKSFISQKIKEHSDNRDVNMKLIVKKFNFANEKISEYLKKSATMPTSLMLQTQIDTLKLVKNWLNLDAE